MYLIDTNVISEARKRAIFRIHEVSFNFTVEQLKFAEQNSVTMLWQGLNQIFNHRSQPPRYLYVLTARLADLGECEMHKIFPIRRPEDHAQSS